MKKLVCLLLVLTSLFSLSSCLGDSVTSPNENSPSAVDEQTSDVIPSTPQEPPAEKTDFVACLKTLLGGYKWNPKSVIPAKLHPEHQATLLNTNHLNNNYNSFVTVSDIPQNGIGEQWNMVIENLSESETFFSILSLVDNVATVSVTAFQNYIDQNPADTAHYQFKEGIYSVTIHCSQNTIDYILDYTTTIQNLGEQSVQIALSMNTATGIKSVRVQIGEDNALAYTVNQNKYSFAIKYLGVRKAFFELIENPDHTITGHIYEYLTISSVEIASIADFYITDDYVTVVGNKANGMVGFEGYLCELYSVSTGKMIAYEVKETLLMPVLGQEVEVTYNTLWFDLEDIDGITSIKYVPAQSNDEEDKIYVNGKSSVWSAKKYGASGGTKIASRRFDIEFRTQYFYYYDPVNERFEKIEQKIPMLFVQEEVYDDLIKDIKDTNNITISVKTSSGDLTKLLSEYSSKIDLPKENKGIYSVATILEFIGNKKSFA